MGFWSTLGKVGSVVAAPFTGGASLAALPIIEGVGQVAGSIAEGQAKGRQAEANEILSRDALRLRAAEAAAANELRQKEFALQAAKERMRQTMLGDLLSNVADTRFNRPATIPSGGRVGGLRPSALGPNARTAGSELSRQALLSLMQGDKFQGFQWEPSELPQAGIWEKILGGVGQGAGLLGAVLGGAKGRSRSSAQPTGDVTFPARSLFPYDSLE